ncbi:uncharacterized protein LOC8079942 isoform X2 [Sorghum bicolor]|nr:uncharacterized protein LOC8079942 isoform X2 [Sorghum bicolor]|eukprot:XP_021308963.1 uncharacterized protein LOC8079942 isoform X2 [Sorghum bicolor]
MFIPSKFHCPCMHHLYRSLPSIIGRLIGRVDLQSKPAMEALYLLASLAATIATSAFHSLLLLLRLLVRYPGRAAPADGHDAAARLYEGRVRHSRRRPAAHAFEYSARYALVNLDLLPLPGHLSADEARRVASTSGPVHLLTIPKSVGYEQNPLSIYYCYDSASQGQDGQLRMCIAEVTNTPWGERVMFTFQPGSDLVAKPLHVSPFMDMLSNWSIRVDAPGDRLYVVISVQHPTLGDYFTAALDAKLVGQTSNSLRLATFFWLMPHKVAAWIYWEALRLWLKNVKFLDHPRYSNPSYRDEALERDLELRASCIFRQRQKVNSQRSRTAEKTAGTTNHVDGKCDENITKRWCVWMDAQWPWS